MKFNFVGALSILVLNFSLVFLFFITSLTSYTAVTLSKTIKLFYNTTVLESGRATIDTYSVSVTVTLLLQLLAISLIAGLLNKRYGIMPLKHFFITQGVFYSLFIFIAVYITLKFLAGLAGGIL
jgi:hypothetical protein